MSRSWIFGGGAEARGATAASTPKPTSLRATTLAHILDAGRERGELRQVPVRTTASLVQAAIDGVMLQWVFDEEAIDLDVSRAEILEMVTRHVMPPRNRRATMSPIDTTGMSEGKKARSRAHRIVAGKLPRLPHVRGRDLYGRAPHGPHPSLFRSGEKP